MSSKGRSVCIYVPLIVVLCTCVRTQLCTCMHMYNYAYKLLLPITCIRCAYGKIPR